jgi:hypothetical protein
MGSHGSFSSGILNISKKSARNFKVVFVRVKDPGERSLELTLSCLKAGVCSYSFFSLILGFNVSLFFAYAEPESYYSRDRSLKPGKLPALSL